MLTLFVTIWAVPIETPAKENDERNEETSLVGMWTLPQGMRAGVSQGQADSSWLAHLDDQPQQLLRRGGLQPEGDDLDASTPPQYPGAGVAISFVAVIETPEAAFRSGVLAAGGDAQLADRFLWAILPCESAGQPPGGFIDWTPGNPEYRSAAQFHPGSWQRVERELGRRLRFEDPYDVGEAVAVWVGLIGEENIATRAGWPICGRRVR